MKRNHELGKKSGDRLRNGLAAGISPPRKTPARRKRRLFRGMAVAAAVILLGAGIAFLAHRLPFLRAKAETVYDAGGRLPHPSASAPSEGFTDAYNRFGLRMLSQLYPEQPNAFLSPASIYLALGMTYNGAQGRTAAEFQQTLSTAGGNLDEFDRDCLGLQKRMAAGGQFRLADSIWIDRSFRQNMSDRFLERNRSFFGGTIGTLDLSSPSAPTVINRWVKANTGNRINPAFRKFDSETVMLLVNTVYFRSNWKNPFDGQRTATGIFQTPTAPKSVRFMHGEYSRYFETDLSHGILLPYDDKKTSLLVLLPKTNLPDMLARLTAADLTTLVKDNADAETRAALALPRVNFSFAASLKTALQNLGLPSAFDPEQADFGAMTKGKANLYISEVMHMTDLAIDEKGTEAAAATSVQMKTTSAPAAPAKTMVVDRPFLAAIVDNETGALLFVGTVSDPTASR